MLVDAREAQAADRAQAGINSLLGVTEAPGQAASRDRMRDLEAAFAPIPRRAAEVAGANDNVTKSIALQRHEWINLSRQMQDVATMAAMGATPMAIISSQAAQVYDVLASSRGGVSGALKDIGSTMLGLVTPARVAFGGIVTGAVAAAAATFSYLSAQKDLETRLNGIGRASGMTVRDVNRMAELRSGSAGLSVSATRDSLAGYAASGRIGAEMSSRLVGTERDLARTLGIEGPEANALLAKSFADPAKGAETLNDRLGFLNDSTRRMIDLQVTAGDRLGAQKTLADAMASSLVNAAEKTNLWTRAWEGLKKGVSDAYDATGQGAARLIAPTLEDQIAKSERRIEDLMSRRPSASNRWGFGTPLDVPDEQDGLLQQEIDNRERLRSEQIARDIKAANDREKAAAAQRSLDVGARVNPYLQEEDAIESLRKSRDALYRDMQNPPSDISADRIRKAWEVADGAVRTYLDSEEKRQKSNELSIRSINARTDAERAAIAVEQKRLELAGQKVDIDRKQAELDAQREVMARSLRAAEDRARSSADSLSLAGLLPYQRSRAEIEQRFRRSNEENARNDGALRENKITRANELRALDIEQRGGPLRTSSSALNEQVAALKLQSDTLFASATQAGYFSERQRLINEYTRAGVTNIEALMPKIDELAKKYGQVAGEAEKYQRTSQNIIGGMDDFRSGGRGMLTGMFSDARQGRDVTQGIANSLGSMADRLFERTVSKPLIENMIGFDGKAGGGFLGDWISKSGIFGTLPTTAAAMTVNAASVVINGGLGGGLAGGIPGITGSVGGAATRSLSGAATPASGGLSLPFGISLGGNGGGTGSAGSVSVDRSGWPYSVLNASAASAAQSVEKMGQATSSAADAAGAFASKVINQLPGLGTSGGVPIGIGSASAAPTSYGMPTNYTDAASWFANGGIMTSRGALPLNFYSGGGIADRPQVAIFGEGRMKEAYVPLPDGRSIPVTMRNALPRTDSSGLGAVSGGGKTEVNIIGAPPGVKVTETEGPKGRRVDIDVGEAIEAYLLSQRGAKTMRTLGASRFGGGR